MKVYLSRSIDFNQMLVASVFIHLLLITIVLFLPKPTIEETLVIPAFMVQMIEEATGQQESAQVPASKPPPPPPVQRKAAKKPAPKAEKQVAKKATPDPVLEALKNIEVAKSAAPSGLVEELEQIAKLETQTVDVQKPEPKEPPPVLDETFKELEALEKKKLPRQENKIIPEVVDNPLTKFNELKLKQTLEAPKAEPEKKPASKLNDEDLAPIEVASLPPKALQEEQKKEKSAADLLNELSQMKDVDEVIVSKTATSEPIQTASVSPEEQKKIYDSVLAKLDTLEVTTMEIDINMASANTDSTEFESELWKIKVSDPRPSAKTGPSSDFVYSAKDGPPASDPLSLYIGAVRNKVYKNWKEPLAERFNKLAVVTFTLFPKGNIDKPYLRKSAGIEQLDTLAIRAVLDSEPFPEFPKDLKLSNLTISIEFKYVPEKS